MTRSLIRRAPALLLRIESAGFLVLLGLLLAISLLPVVLRATGGAGITWAQPFAEYLVLWIALFGAAAATHDRKHIAIDAVGHYLPPRAQLGLRGLGELLACVVLAWLLPHALAFVSDEREFGGDDTALWGVPAWWLPCVIPAGLAWIAVRLLLAASVDLWNAATGRTRPDGD